MEGNGDADRERGYFGVDNSAAEGDGDADRGRYSMLARCASQSSLDESSQRALAREPPPAPHHAAQMLHALAALRSRGTLCDVRLQAVAPAECGGGGGAEGGAGAGEPVWAHRAVLAAASPYFHAMFTQFDERTQPLVTIQNVEPEALAAIVEYVYAPESLVISEENVQALLSGASLVQVAGVRAACCAFLGGALGADNVLGILAFAELHACAPLAAAAQRHLEAHFVEVLDADEFLALDAPALAALLDNDRVTVPGEELVLDAVVRWVQHDAEARRAHLAPLLERVRLPLVAHEALVARAAQQPLAGGGVRVKDLLIEALSFHLMRPEARAAAAEACPRARPRRPPRAPRALLVAGGQAPKAICEAEALLPEGGGGGGDGGGWRAAAPLPARRCRAGLAALHGKVYAVGGFNGSLRVRTVDVYDVAAGAWGAGPPLVARRSTLGVAVLGNVIYAVGGFDGATGLNSAEALDPREGSWRSIAPMASRRSSVGVGVGVAQGRLYAVGGYDGASRQCLASVECYDPAADRWAPAPDMALRRSGCGVGVAGGALYALGGHDGPAVRRSVERLLLDAPDDPQWMPAPPMHKARRNAAVAHHDGRLYVVGGDDGAANLDTVEVFDPATDSWSVLPAPMSVGRSYAGVAVVEWPP